jgi:hypothetical protein
MKHKLVPKKVYLPPLFDQYEYFPVFYSTPKVNKNYYVYVSWLELKAILPATYNFVWNVNKHLYLKLKLNLEKDVFHTNIVGFDHVNKISNRLLKQTYARSTFNVNAGNYLIQLQVCFYNVNKLSSNKITQCRNDCETYIKNIVFETPELLFKKVLLDLDDEVTRYLKQKYSFKNFQIVKCKVLN